MFEMHVPLMGQSLQHRNTEDLNMKSSQNKNYLQGKGQERRVFVALLWKPSAPCTIVCLLSMQQYLHSWKARIKPILYIYGGRDREQKPGQVSLRNEHSLLACTSKFNLNFAALAASRKLMCSCLHAHFGERELLIQLLSSGKYVQVSQTKKKKVCPLLINLAAVPGE